MGITYINILKLAFGMSATLFVPLIIEFSKISGVSPMFYFGIIGAVCSIFFLGMKETHNIEFKSVINELYISKYIEHNALNYNETSSS